MTTGLGIAATSAVLRSLFENALPKANLMGVLGNVEVSALPPDRIDVETETSRLNLFMYQVLPNPGWRNTDLPSHDTTGRRLTNPPLALDLHYMLSAYGAGNFHAEILLGYGALLVHQTRVLTRAVIRAAFAGTGGLVPADLALLSTAGLDGQEEIVKLSMLPQTVDDISRLWAVFGEKYRPSFAFVASVLLVRGEEPAGAGLPVRLARLASTTSIHPTIDRIEPQMITAGPAAIVDLIGTGLFAPDAAARFGSGESVPPGAGSTPQLLHVPVPATLRAGLNTVRVSLPARFDTDLRPGPESNAAPFMLRPVFAVKAGTASDPDITVSGLSTTATTASATVTVRLVPPVGRRQNVALLLSEAGVAAGAVPHAYAVRAPSREQDAAEVTGVLAFAVVKVAKGNYLARVRVDGAETPLTAAADGTFTAPVVNLS